MSLAHSMGFDQPSFIEKCHERMIVLKDFSSSLKAHLIDPHHVYGKLATDQHVLLFIPIMRTC